MLTNGQSGDRPKDRSLTHSSFKYREKWVLPSPIAMPTLSVPRP